VTKREALNGKPYAGNPHVRFDEGEAASTATSRRGSLLYNKTILAVVALCMSTAVLAADTDAYIESDGSTGIDTGYRVKPNTRIAVDFALTTIEGQANGRLFGADYNSSALKMALGFYVGSNNDDCCWVIGFGNEAGWTGGWAKDASGKYLNIDMERHLIEYDFPRGRHTFYTDAKAIAWYTDSKSYSSEATSSITLFSTKDNSGNERAVKARIYGVKIYEKIDDEYVLVRNFVPCVATGRMGMPEGVAVPGFKCLVTGGFIGSGESYSTFSAGNNPLMESSAPAYVTLGAVADKEYIDTCYYATDRTKVELDYSFNDTFPWANNGWLFSSSGSGGTFGVYVKKDGSGFGMHNGSGWGTASCSLVGDVGIPRTAVLDYPKNELLLQSGIVTNFGPVSAGAVTGKEYNATTLKIGARFDGGSEFASLKIYGFRIFEDGAMVRDFMPCKQDGVIGLKDRITGRFIACAKPLGALDCGGDVAVRADPYIETEKSKSQYLDTGHIPTVNTRIEVDYALAAAYDSGTWNIFRGRIDSDDYFTCYHNSNGFGAKNAGGWPGAVKDFANVSKIRRTAVLDNYNDKGALVTAGVTNYSVSSVNPTGLSGTGAAIRLSSTQAGAEFGSFRFYACRIYEADVLQHEYLPSVKADGSVGLQDTKSETFLPVLSITSTNPQVFGGAFMPTVTPSATKLCAGKDVVLTATAPGAKSYRWLKNGEPISGGEDGKLAVEWRKGCETDTYQAITIASVDGVDAEGDASTAVTVENLVAPLVISIR